MDKCTRLSLDMSEIVLRSLSLADFSEYAKDNDDPGIFEDAENSINAIGDIVGKLSLTSNDAAFIKDRINNVKEAFGQYHKDEGSSISGRTPKGYAAEISLNGYELARATLAIAMKSVAQCVKSE